MATDCDSFSTTAPRPNQGRGIIASAASTDAIVSTGNREEVVTLPAMPRVIGGDRLLDLDHGAADGFSTPVWRIYGATNQLGAHRLAAAQH